MLSKRTLKRLTVIMSILFLLVASGWYQEGRLDTILEQDNMIMVDVQNELHDISPLVYGANYGPWVGVPFEMFDIAAASGITYLRFPGGEWGDKNDLKPYHFDTFMHMINLVNAIPQVNIRMQNGTPEQAAELVHYTNIESNYNIKYWAVGNEPNLYTSFSMYDDMTVDEYNKLFREYYQAMKAIDPNILIIGPEITNFYGGGEPYDTDGKSWMREFLIANGDIVDIVSFHRYPFPEDMNSTPTTKQKLFASTEEWDELLENTKSMILELTGREIPLAVTEINSHWTHATGGEATPDSFYNAIWWADVLGEMIEHDIAITAYFLMQCKISQGGYGLIGKYDIRPTYYVYQQFKEFGNKFLASKNLIDGLSVYASKRDDNAITVILINKTEKLLLEEITLNNDEYTLKTIQLFDQTHLAEQVEIEKFTTNGKINIVPESIILLVYQK